MYNFLLHAHSGLRWIVLLAVIIAVVKSLIGLFSNGNYTTFDKVTSLVFVNTMRLQFVIGLLLYFVYSPITTRFTFNMDDPIERFWSVEHLALMILAVGAAEMGKSISKKSDDSLVKFRFQTILFGISLLLMIVGIPWNRV